MNLLIDVSFGKDLALDPEEVRKAAGMDRLGDLRDRFVREMPGFSDCSNPKVRNSLASHLRDSIRKKERLWLMPMSDELLDAWNSWLPSDLLTPLGERQEFQGEMVVPMGVAPMKLVKALADRRTADDILFLQKALHGVDGLALSSAAYDKIMDAGIAIVPRSRVLRVITNPRFIAYVVVFVYSAMRALPVTFVKQFQGSLLVLWAIDLGTAIPYTWGVLAMVTASRFHQRFLGLVVTVVTFMLPYVYFGMYGRHYPPWVILIVALLIAATFFLEGYKMWADRRVRQSLTSNGDRG